MLPTWKPPPPPTFGGRSDAPATVTTPDAIRSTRVVQASAAQGAYVPPEVRLDLAGALDDPSLRASDPTSYEQAPKSALVPATPAKSARAVSSRVASAQVIVAAIALVAAPVLTLASSRPSGLAFAVHGIGALATFALSTMAMHKAYPLMRGGGRTWPALKTMLARLAVVSVGQLASSAWLLHYYLAGPAKVLAQSAPVVDQVAMQAKIFCGLAGLVCFVVSWWSSRSVNDERGHASVQAPVFALAAGWMFMVIAMAMGAAVSWVMPT